MTLFERLAANQDMVGAIAAIRRLQDELIAGLYFIDDDYNLWKVDLRETERLLRQAEIRPEGGYSTRGGRDLPPHVVSTRLINGGWGSWFDPTEGRFIHDAYYGERRFARMITTEERDILKRSGYNACLEQCKQNDA